MFSSIFIREFLIIKLHYRGVAGHFGKENNHIFIRKYNLLALNKMG